MASLTIRARSLPYRPPSTVTDRVCTRCGIQFRNHHIKRHGYHTECRDCRDMDQIRTADGRDLTTAEWRTIPGFRKYQITPDGDIRNRRTGRLLTESENPTTGAYSYTLWRDDGGKTSRNYLSLIRDAYPAGESNE